MRSYIRFAAILAAVAGAVSTSFATQPYKMDPAHSTIGFKVHQYLTTVAGKFTRFSGTVDVDPDHPEKSSVAAKIDVPSIDTGIAKRDTHLRSAEFFNVAKFPGITFKSRSVKRTGANTGDITGDFTMHGVTKAIILHAKLLGDPKSAANAPTWSAWLPTRCAVAAMSGRSGERKSLHPAAAPKTAAATTAMLPTRRPW